MTFTNVKDWFELFSYAATIIGIPLAIVVYMNGRKEDKRLKKEEALFTSHGLYVDYLKLCLENPELEIYDITYKKPEFSTITKKEFIAFEILFAYLESAFHYYREQSDEFKQKRWSGWVTYIKGYIRQENFLKAWELTGNEWETDFSQFLNSLIVEHKKQETLKDSTNA